MVSSGCGGGGGFFFFFPGFFSFYLRGGLVLLSNCWTMTQLRNRELLM